MPDAFGRMTSSEASKKLQDFCFPKLKCIRCGCDFKPPEPMVSSLYESTEPNVCGSCADDLRAEQDAQAGALKAEAANIEFQMNKEAYEDALTQEHYDRP